MQLRLIFPHAETATITPPSRCRYKDCRSTRIRLYQQVTKPLRDTAYQQVTVHRYQCLACGRTFRVYPPGVCKDHTSQQMKELAVILYLLGLNYHAVVQVFEALGVYLGKSWVCNAVQARAERASGLKRVAVFEGIRTLATGGDITALRFRGRWLPLGLVADASRGLMLTIDELSKKDAQPLKEWIAPIAEVMGAELLVNDEHERHKLTATLTKF